MAVEQLTKKNTTAAQVGKENRGHIVRRIYSIDLNHKFVYTVIAVRPQARFADEHYGVHE